jgi:phosphoglycolate phosphatase
MTVGVTTMLFDLDGTISASEPGIVGSLQLAFAELGLPPLTDEVARTLVGPPFYESLPPLVGLERMPEVIERYRDHYAQLMFDTEVYAGIPELLAELERRQVRLAVATSKPETSATRIVEHLGLTDRFVTVTGDELDGSRADKALVVAEALRRLGGPDPATVLMVGDREHDVHGSGVHGISCLGAAWGYGGVDELGRAGARETFATAADLHAQLDRLLAAS